MSNRTYLPVNDKQPIYKTVCQNCFEDFECNRLRKFCSYECEKIYHRNKQRENVRLALQTGRTNNIYLKLRFEIFKRDNFACVYCGRTPKDGTKLEIDHIIPKSKGGLLNAQNLVTSCFECNEGKRDILLEEHILKERKKINVPIPER